MKAQVMSGPYAGRSFDHHDLNLYATFVPVGQHQFFLLPPLANWEDVTHERLPKEGPFEGDKLMYVLARYPDRFELHFDEEGRIFAQAAEHARVTPPPTAADLVGLSYECVPAEQVPDELGWPEIVDEKDRTWRYREQPRGYMQNVMPGMPQGVTHLAVHYAESMDDLRRSLSDLLDNAYRHPK